MTKGQDTRQKLLETALELIWASNYASVSVDDICAKADVRKGSFYHYFSSKSELAIASLEHSWEELRRELDGIFSPQVPPLERLKKYCKIEYDLQLDAKKKYGYVVGCPYTSIGCEQCGCDDKLRQTAGSILERVKKYLISTLREAREEGSIAVSDYAKKADELFYFELGVLAACRIQNSLDGLKQLEPVWASMLGLEKSSLKKAA